MKKQQSGRRPAGKFRYDAIWRIVERIPRGRVASYGQIAVLAGLARQARFVGYALHNLPAGLPVPWHRVVNARGGISFPEGSQSALQQLALLQDEGVLLRGGRVDLARFGWRPRSRQARAPRRIRVRRSRTP